MRYSLIHLLPVIAIGGNSAIPNSLWNILPIVSRTLPRVDPPTNGTYSKRVYFIRHAESNWNAASTKLSKLWNSVITDASFSSHGTEQAQLMASWLEGNNTACTSSSSHETRYNDNSAYASCDTSGIVRHIMVENTTTWATSNLKRAVLTAVIGLRDEIISNSRPTLHVLSALQEDSKGMDARANTKAREIPDIRWASVEMCY